MFQDKNNSNQFSKNEYDLLTIKKSCPVFLGENQNGQKEKGSKRLF
jgi:hypothetical protein